MLNGYSGSLLERIKDCENGIIDIWANKFKADMTKNYFEYDSFDFALNQNGVFPLRVESSVKVEIWIFVWYTYSEVLLTL